jgi:hypothetical protein
MKIQIQKLGWIASGLWIYGVLIVALTFVKFEALNQLNLKGNLIFYLFIPTFSILLVLETVLRMKLIIGTESSNELHYSGCGRFISETTTHTYRFGPLGIERKD